VNVATVQTLFIFRFLIAYCSAIVCNTIVGFFATIVVN